MKVKEIHLHNFLCYKDSVLALNSDRILNVYGLDLDRETSNGIGKSALKEAMLFALYGKSKISLKELVRKGTNKCFVRLLIEVGTDLIDIKRTYSSTSSLTIKVNGVEPTLPTLTKKKEFLKELIGMDYDTFVNFSIFDAIRFEDLSSLSSTEIKRLLQILFDYNKFSASYQKLKQELLTNNNVLIQLQNRKSHYYSLKRYSFIQQSVQRIKNYQQLCSKKIKILNNHKYSLLHNRSSLQTTVATSRQKIKRMIQHKECPECGKPLDHKMKILNTEQQSISRKQLQIKEINRKLEIVDLFLLKWQNGVDDCTRKIIKAQNSLACLNISKQKIQDLQQVKDKSAQLKYFTELMKKFESYVMDHYVQYLEQTFNEYLAQLTDIQCKISFMKQGSLITRSIDKFYMTLHRGNHDFSYMSLSSGERMLVAYAFKLAINTLSFKDTFLFIDEGFNRLDKSNRSRLLKMLEHSPFDQIFLISHDDPFKSIPTIYITKQNDVSSVCIK